MISAFRRSLLLLATAVVALLGTISISTFPLVHGGDDPACDLQAVVHDGSHQVSSGGAAPADGKHCILCHWSRWVRAIQNDASAVTRAVERDPVAAASVTQPRTTTVSRSAPRAPPLA